MTVQGVGVWVALTVVLEMVCENDVAAVLKVIVLGEEDAVVGLFQRLPQMLFAA